MADPYGRDAGSGTANLFDLEPLRLRPKGEIGLEEMGGGPGAAPAMRAALGKAMAAPKPGIDVWHASPYDFNEFRNDASTLHTGEGATTFGKGTYFSDSPALSGPGSHYDRMFTAKNLGKYDLDEMEGAIFEAMRAGRSDADIQSEMARQGHDPGAVLTTLGTLREKAGKVYQSRIDAAPEDFLDWFEPLGNQRDHLAKVVAHLGGEEHVMQKRAEFEQLGADYLADRVSGNQYDAGRNSAAAVGDILHGMQQPAKWTGYDPASKQTGETLYRALSRGRYDNEDTAVDTLKGLGIPGLKHSGSFARQKGEKDKVYVVFDPKIVSIVAKLGVAGALAAGLITEEMARQMRAQGST